MTSPVSLRPLGVGQILDRAIRIYRRGLLPLTLIALAAAVPSAALTAAAGSDGLGKAAATLARLALATLADGAVVVAGLQAIRGEPIAAWPALRMALSRYPSLLGAAVLDGLAVGVPGTLFAILVLISGIIHGFAGEPIMLVGSWLTAVAIGAKFAVATPAVIAEGLGGATAMGRSWVLSEGRYWRAAAVFGASSLLAALIAYVPGALIERSSWSLATIGAGQLELAQVLWAAVSTLVTLPIADLISVVLYEDLRVRREGSALERAIEQFAEGPEALEPAAEALPMRHDVD